MSAVSSLAPLSRCPSPFRPLTSDFLLPWSKRHAGIATFGQAAFFESATRLRWGYQQFQKPCEIKIKAIERAFYHGFSAYDLGLSTRRCGFNISDDGVVDIDQVVVERRRMLARREQKSPCCSDTWRRVNQRSRWNLAGRRAAPS